MSEDVNAITRTYDLLKWLMPAVSKFPKDKRYTLGLRIEDKALIVLELLIKANYSRVKLDLLKTANLEIEVLRHLLRLSYELKFINLKSYEYASQQANEIGRLIGGWIGQQTAK